MPVCLIIQLAPSPFRTFEILSILLSLLAMIASILLSTFRPASSMELLPVLLDLWSARLTELRPLRNYPLYIVLSGTSQLGVLVLKSTLCQF